ncbi:hypothetical protein [Actinobacillus porcinus]|uniref:hypothetical protein n=1 Tax=Actinobacillus porcinus TaxID=51048 RepID=UPI002354700E|nr:hypothetical protein [Actinobacillus porcinus]
MSNNNLALLAAAAYGKFHNLNNFIRTSYLKDKVRLKNVNFSNNNDARSYFDITSSRSTSLINNPDFLV